MAAQPDRIIIYRLGSLGDTVAALPCFHLIERAYPDAERLVLTNVPVSSKAAPVETILRPAGFIHGSIPYVIGTRNPSELRRLATAIRDSRAHTLVYLAASRGLPAAWRDIGFFRICGFKHIVGAPLTRDLQRNRVDGAGRLERETHRLSRTLASLGTIDLDDRSWWDLRLTRQEYAAADEQLGALSKRPHVAVNTGGKAAEKDWGVRAWRSTIASLRDHLGDWGLTFLGGREDHERATNLAGSFSGPIANLCGRLTPRESAAAVSRASLFIGHDSGVLHLADAVGTPAVGLFGDYNKPTMWHPSGSRTRIIHRMTGLQNISPTEVLDVAVQLTMQTPRVTTYPAG